jgi:hypothetical protein
MADDFDISRLLASLETVDGWTITGSNSARRTWEEADGEDVEAHFSPSGENVDVELFVDAAGASTGPFTSSFSVNDFSGSVERSAVGSKFHRWVVHTLSQNKSKRFGPETKVPTEVWTRYGGPPDGAYKE